jgi:hypothetical protein
MTAAVSLSTIDGQLLDGLEFCGKVYDLFDQITRESDGKSRLRLRRSQAEKKLVEELLPLARYILARYREGRRIKVRWLSGSQPYDAILWSTGTLVEHGGVPRRVVVEITTSVHPNDPDRRQLLDQCGGSFGVKGIHRVGREIISKPHVFSGGENARDLAEQILGALRPKADKPYPPSTMLIVNCVTNGLMLEDEWADAIGQVTEARPQVGFREVFILDMLMSHTVTLYGNRQSRRQKVLR